MQLKNVTCNYFLVACDMWSCIRQVAKDNVSTSDVELENQCATLPTKPF